MISSLFSSIAFFSSFPQPNGHEFKYLIASKRGVSLFSVFAGRSISTLHSISNHVNAYFKLAKQRDRERQIDICRYRFFVQINSTYIPFLHR